jgi:hypothetical protein
MGPGADAWGYPTDCGRVLFGSRVAEMKRRVTVHTRHQLKQATKHHEQKRVSLVATEAIVVETPRTIVVVLKGTIGAPRVMAGVLLVRKWVLPANGGSTGGAGGDEGRAPDDGGGGGGAQQAVEGGEALWRSEVGADTQDVGHDRDLATRNLHQLEPVKHRSWSAKKACSSGKRLR